MDVVVNIPPQIMLFYILYGITGIVPLLAAAYLLLRRSNAIAPGIMPPMRLRRWAAAFFAASALAHVWWLLFYIYSSDLHSVSYMVVVTLDYTAMVTTITGTMLSMLQDRRRPIWPAFVAMMPFMMLEVFQMCCPDRDIRELAIAYNLALYVLFFIYMVFAIRRYGQWLNENFADLEHKKVWLSQAVSLAYVLMFILYVLVDTNFNLVFLLHIVELVFFGLLLWRVETLTQLEETIPALDPTECLSQQEPFPLREVSGQTSANEPSSTLPSKGKGGGSDGGEAANIEQLLAKFCVATQLYLQHDLTVQQLAQAIGTNRTYLSQYFSSLGITYNTYINNLRINHFISSYQEAATDGRPFTAQQLARESGYRSYSTFSRAFMQRTGQSVTAWMHDAAE